MSSAPHRRGRPTCCSWPGPCSPSPARPCSRGRCIHPHNLSVPRSEHAVRRWTWLTVVRVAYYALVALAAGLASSTALAVVAVLSGLERAVVPADPAGRAVRLPLGGRGGGRALGVAAGPARAGAGRGHPLGPLCKAGCDGERDSGARARALCPAHGRRMGPRRAGRTVARDRGHVLLRGHLGLHRPLRTPGPAGPHRRRGADRGPQPRVLADARRSPTARAARCSSSAATPCSWRSPETTTRPWPPRPPSPCGPPSARPGPSRPRSAG